MRSGPAALVLSASQGLRDCNEGSSGSTSCAKRSVGISSPLHPTACSGLRRRRRVMGSLDAGFCVRLRDGFPEPRGDAQFFRGHVISRGPGAAADGSFATWQWNGRRLIARTDRYGVNPLFYWHDGRDVGVSPSPLVLLQQGAPASLDHEALSVFLVSDSFSATTHPSLR
jgi:hypothetical protein